MLAAMPATCGQDIEVPESTLNLGGSLPSGVVSADVSLANHAAIILTPGAEISGCKTFFLEPLLGCYFQHKNNDMDLTLRMFFVLVEGPLAEK